MAYATLTSSDRAAAMDHRNLELLLMVVMMTHSLMRKEGAATDDDVQLQQMKEMVRALSMAINGGDHSAISRELLAVTQQLLDEQLHSLNGGEQGRVGVSSSASNNHLMYGAATATKKKAAGAAAKATKKRNKAVVKHKGKKIMSLLGGGIISLITMAAFTPFTTLIALSLIHQSDGSSEGKAPPSLPPTSSTYLRHRKLQSGNMASTSHTNKSLLSAVVESTIFSPAGVGVSNDRRILLENVELVGEGKVIDIDSFGEEGVWLVSSRKVDVDSHQQDGAGASEKNVEDDEVIEVESVQLPQDIGFFDLAPHLNPEYLATLTAEDRSGLFGYIGDDVEEVERRLGTSCGDGKTSFLLEIKPDQDNLDDNEFKVFIGQSTSSMSQIMKKGSFNSANTVTAGMCAPEGFVRVVATDASGDGMKNGSYTVYLGGYIVATSPGTDKWSERVHTLDTASASSNSVPPPTPQPTPQPVSSDAISGRNTCFEPQTSEEQDYLDEHNKNRKYYHEMLGAEYKPLTWSTDLADEAANYAQSLLRYCCTTQLPHDSNNIGKHGENLASNCGSGSYGQRKAATDILNRWVYMEHSKDSYTAKYHYTQALWRASDYVGCGVATKDMGNGATCYMQVCRYQKPGNCAINQDNHIMRMLSDSSGCGGVAVSC